MNFAIYMVGALLLILGIGYGAYLMGFSQAWILVVVLIVLGLIVMTGVAKTRKGPSPEDHPD